MDRRASETAVTHPAWFGVWVLIGTGAALVPLAILSIGVFVAPFVIGAVVLLARWPASWRGWPGAITGLGLPMLFVAHENRDGPGMVCTATEFGEHCGEQWNPWPWLVVGAACVFAGIAVFFACERR